VAISDGLSFDESVTGPRPKVRHTHRNRPVREPCGASAGAGATSVQPGVCHAPRIRLRGWLGPPGSTRVLIKLLTIAAAGSHRRPGPLPARPPTRLRSTAGRGGA
jgi:hypothetical protein